MESPLVKLDFKMRFIKFNSRESLSVFGKVAVSRIYTSARKHDVNEGLLFMATFGMYMYLTAKDGKIDQAELDLYNSFAEKPVTKEGYEELAFLLSSKDGSKLVFDAVERVLKADPSLEVPLSDLAYAAISANGKISLREKIYYKLLFEV